MKENREYLENRLYNLLITTAILTNFVISIGIIHYGIWMLISLYKLVF